MNRLLIGRIIFCSLMNKEQFYTYLNNPDALNESSLKVLNEIINEYPYFQTAHLLYLKNLHKLGHLKFTKQLRVSSTYLADREILYNFLYTQPIVYSEDKFSGRKESETEDTLVSDNENIVAKKKEKAKSKKSTKKSSTKKLKADTEASKNSEVQISNNKAKEEEVSDVSKINAGTNDTHSFAEWLEIFHNRQDGNKYDKTLNTSTVKKEQVEHKDNSDKNEQLTIQDKLITSFINSDPKIEVSVSDKTEQKDISKESVVDDDSFITETLAKIYVSQKHFGKAINAYEKLSLKYPEKNIYFAHQIKEITKLINK